MKKLNRKGFTMVELIIVIVIIGVLAAVLIPTFGGIIRKANDSAYQQDRTNQMIQDAIEKIDKGDKYMSWEDLEEAIANALKDQSDDKNLADKLIVIIKENGKETGMTDEQLTAILEAIANKKLSDIQVRIILEGIKNGENPVLTEQQIAAILAKLPQVGITQEDVTAAVNAVLGETNTVAIQIKQAIADALDHAALSKEDIAAIIDQIIESNLDAIGDYVARIGRKGYETLAAAVADAKDGDTIVMLKNHITAAQTFSKTLTLDLNGKAVSGTADMLLTFNGTGSFTVKDSSINGSITGFKVAVRNSGTGTVVIDGGTITATASTNYGIYNTAAGTIIVNNGLVSGKYGIYNSALDATIRVNGGEIRGGSKSGIFCLLGKGDVIITGGTVTSTSDSGICFSANQNYNSMGQGSLIASGNASISGTYGIFSGNPSNITLSGNTAVTGSGDYGIYLVNKTTTPASITINDSAKISGNSKYGVYVYTTNAVNTLNINNNSEIKGLTYGVYDYNGVVNINGGSIRSTETDKLKWSYGVSNNGTINLNGGDVESARVGIYESNAAGVVNLDGGTISASEGIMGKGTANIKSGTINASNAAIYDYNASNTLMVNISGGIINSDNSGVRLVSSTSSLSMTNGTINAEYYGVFSTGTATVSGGEIMVTGEYRDEGETKYIPFGIFSYGTSDNKADVTINGGSISAPNGYALDLYHTDATITDGTLSGVNAIESWTEDSTCTISSGTFNATAGQVCYANEGFFTISGGTFTGGGTTQYEDDIYRFTLNCKDEKYTGDLAGYTVTGGTFYQFNPQNNQAEGQGTDFTNGNVTVTYNDATKYYTVTANN